MAQTPLSPSVLCKQLPNGPVVAISTHGGATTDRSQTIAGTFSDASNIAPAGQVIEIDDNGTTIGTAVVANNGLWSDDVVLSDLGTNKLTASATDAKGQVGASAPVTFTLDTVLSPPQAGSTTPEPARSIVDLHIATLFATGGRDTFVFTTHPGQTVVEGFALSGASVDHLSFANRSFAGIADIIRHTTISGVGAVIHLDPHDSVTLVGVTKSELQKSPSTFLFHA